MSGSERIRLSQHSVVRCPKQGCRGTGTIQTTQTLDRQYVKRSRCCDVCGHTWSTMELPLELTKRLLALDKAVNNIYGRKK
jgi:transcriptional regulator NrdR family protein